MLYKATQCTSVCFFNIFFGQTKVLANYLPFSGQKLCKKFTHVQYHIDSETSYKTNRIKNSVQLYQDQWIFEKFQTRGHLCMISDFWVIQSPFTSVTYFHKPTQYSNLLYNYVGWIKRAGFLIYCHVLPNKVCCTIIMDTRVPTYLKIGYHMWMAPKFIFPVSRQKMCKTHPCAVAVEVVLCKVCMQKGLYSFIACQNCGRFSFSISRGDASENNFVQNFSKDPS